MMMMMMMMMIMMMHAPYPDRPLIYYNSEISGGR